MPEVEIPIFNGVYRNVDESVSNDKNWEMYDAILDKEKNLFTRPGLLITATANSATADSPENVAVIDGAFWWDSKETLVLVSGGLLYSVVAPFTTPVLVNVTQFFNIGVRPTFATYGDELFIANGSQIVKWVYSAGTVAYLTDAQAPTAVTHITIIDTYLVANSVGTGNFYFADPADPSSWSALSFAGADAKPDILAAIYQFRNELFMLGKESVEVWEDDGQTPFARVNGGALSTGCLAPYSVVESDNSLIFLAKNRRFVRIGGGQIANLDCPYEKEELQEWEVEDCRADRWDIIGKTIFVFWFPAQDVTIYFNETDNNWGRFGYWDSNSGSYQAFLGSCYACDPATNNQFIGSRKANGKLYLLSPDYGDDNGDPIRVSTVSGHTNYGTNREKVSRELTFNVSRGGVQDSTEPVCTLRVKDNKGEWSNEIQISLGRMGEYYGSVSLPRMGRFRTRQYEFACADPVKFIFSDAKEDLVVV